MIGVVGRTLAIPGGSEEVVGPELGAGAVGAWVGSSCFAQAAMSAAAAAAPIPSRVSRLMASRLVSRPSTWSVAISSAM